MICRNCKNEMINPVKVRRGSICQHCYDGLPESVKVNITHFSLKHIKQIQELVNEPEEQGLVSCGTFRACRTAIQVNEKEFKIKNLSSVKLNFHPASLGINPGTVVGTLTVVIDTKVPHYMFEEPLYRKEVTASYRINGKNVTYGYSYKIEKLFACIQKCLDDGSQDLTAYLDEYESAVKRNQQEKEKKKAQSGASASGQKRQSEGTSQKGQAHQNNTDRNGANNHRTAESPLDEAKRLFNVTAPYTKADIKKIRNRLMKMYHPDVGGSEEMCKKVNEAYALLLKYVY